MRKQLMVLITALGKTAVEVRERRQRPQDWRAQEWLERFDARHRGHITGEVPSVQPQG